MASCPWLSPSVSVQGWLCVCLVNTVTKDSNTPLTVAVFILFGHLGPRGAERPPPTGTAQSKGSPGLQRVWTPVRIVSGGHTGDTVATAIPG